MAETQQGAARRSAVDRYFEITERGSTIGREVRGGIVTFVTMAYIVVLNPIILTTTTDVAGDRLRAHLSDRGHPASRQRQSLCRRRRDAPVQHRS